MPTPLEYILEIFVGFGRRSDPTLRAIKELLNNYFTLLECVKTPLLQAQLAFARAKAKARVCVRNTCGNNKYCISSVNGILTNIIYVLYMNGWDPAQATRWVAPDMDQWSFPPSGFPRAHVIYALQDSASLILWKKASNHHLGKGLSTGLAWAHSTLLVRQLRSSDPGKASGI